MIVNKRTGQGISTRELICASWWLQVRGLMFRRRMNLMMVFLVPRQISLHNFFVFYPIDVFVLDEERRVIEIKRDFKPFRMWFGQKKGKYVVEMGVRNDANISLGDKWEWK